MDRRTFIAAGGATILGLPYLRAQDAKPTWFDEGLKRIKSTGLPGIVVIVPDKRLYGTDYAVYTRLRDEMLRLSDALTARVDKGGADVQALLAGAVWICLLEKDAREKFKEPTRLMLIDGDAKILESADPTIEEFEKDETFVKAVRPLAEKDFAARLESAWKKVDADALRQELTRLCNDDPDVRDAASKALAKRLPDALPILIDESRKAKDPEVSGRIAAILAGPALPFGAQWCTARGSSCGDPREMVECGMAGMNAQERKVVKFLSLQEAP